MFSCWGWSGAQVLIGHGQLDTLWTAIQHFMLAYNTTIIWSHFVVGYNACHRITLAIQSPPFNTCCHLFQLIQTISIRDQRCRPKLLSNPGTRRGGLSELENCLFEWQGYLRKGLRLWWPGFHSFNASIFSSTFEGNLQARVDGGNGWDLRAWSWSGQQQLPP